MAFGFDTARTAQTDSCPRCGAMTILEPQATPQKAQPAASPASEVNGLIVTGILALISIVILGVAILLVKIFKN